MTTLKPLLARNRSWAQQKCQHDPDYFEKWVDGQRPHSLWIGCSDSRVPAEVPPAASPANSLSTAISLICSTPPTTTS